MRDSFIRLLFAYYGQKLKENYNKNTLKQIVRHQARLLMMYNGVDYKII